MYRIRSNAPARSIIMLFTAVAVMASFSFAAAEPLQAVRLAAEWRGGLSEDVCRLLPAPAGTPALFNLSYDTRGSFLRMDSQRYFTPRGINAVQHAFYILQSGINSKKSFLNIKDTILLKLRV